MYFRLRAVEYALLKLSFAQGIDNCKCAFSSRNSVGIAAITSLFTPPCCVVGTGDAG